MRRSPRRFFNFRPAHSATRLFEQSGSRSPRILWESAGRLLVGVSTLPAERGYFIWPDDQITALHEAQAFGFPASSIAIVPVECNLHAVVDLRDPAVQALLHTNHLELSANFRSLAPGSPPSPTQLLGERVSASLRIDGLIYDSSARPGHTNLALIEAALKALGSFAAVNDPNNKLFDSLP